MAKANEKRGTSRPALEKKELAHAQEEAIAGTDEPDQGELGDEYVPRESVEEEPEEPGRENVAVGSGISKPVALIVSAVLLVCIIFLGYLLITGMKGAVQGEQTGAEITEGDSVDLVTLPAAQSPQSRAECLASYGLNPERPIFAYSESCAVCASMKPVVAGLEDKGRLFQWVDRDNLKNNVMLSKCLKGIVGEYVPQIICPKTGAQETGSMTEGEIVSFLQSRCGES